MSTPALAPSSEVYKPYPFRWIFPLGQLLLCLFLLGLIRSTRGLIPWSYAQLTFQTIAAFNLPALIIQLPIIIVRADKREWMPPGMDLFFWRAATWPVINLVFWWIAGRATEALVSIPYRQLKPRISWAEAILGFLFVAGGVTLLVGLVFWGTTAADRADGTFRRFVAGAGLWAFLGALSVIARFRQWRLRKKMTTHVA
jgi:hypothetical protein